jgi:hypothetical protein
VLFIEEDSLVTMLEKIILKQKQIITDIDAAFKIIFIS